MSVAAFCALAQSADIDQAIQETERDIAAAQAADAVRKQPQFEDLALPDFDLETISNLLNSDLPGLDTDAATRVQAHLTKLGTGGEAWIANGMKRITDAESCPFCDQRLTYSALISQYQAYFSSAYNELKQQIASGIKQLTLQHGGDAISAFERAVRVIVERRQFWGDFMDVPEIALDTVAIALARNTVSEPVLSALQKKQASPLDLVPLPPHSTQALATYRDFRENVSTLSANLRAVNQQIMLVKERAESANLAALSADLVQQRAIKARYKPKLAALCDAYLAEKNAKVSTELLRDASRKELDQCQVQNVV